MQFSLINLVCYGCVLATAALLSVANADENRSNAKAVADFTTCDKPKWPLSSLRNEEEGSTVIEFAIGADGAVQSARILESSGFESLDNAALEGIRLCKFVAARRNGKPVASVLAVQYKWALDNDTDASAAAQEQAPSGTQGRLASLIQRGRDQLLIKDFRGAMESSVAALKLDRKNFDANFLAANASLGLNVFDDADRFLEQAAQFAPATRRDVVASLKKTIAQQRVTLEPVLRRLAAERLENETTSSSAPQQGGAQGKHSIKAASEPAGRTVAAGPAKAGEARGGSEQPANTQPAAQSAAGSQAAGAGKCPASLDYLAPKLPVCSGNANLIELRRIALATDVSFRADAAAGYALKDVALMAGESAKRFEDAMKENEEVMASVANSDELLRERLQSLRATPPQCDAQDNPATMGQSAYNAYVASYMGAMVNRAVSAIAACKARLQP
ncbi:energy transducer TonB [Oxalobacteraceae bacterium A2-2]